MTETITLDIPAPQPRKYDILIGENLLARAGTEIHARLGTRRCIIVSDSHVAPLYADLVRASLIAEQKHEVLKSIVFPAGEANKDLDTLECVLDQMLENGMDRKTLVVALGGGVVGDMAGFAASIIERGVAFVQIPTTLLAQVDSSVGGKTGIDTKRGKNLIGTFHQPSLVLADIGTLTTLPGRELRAGYAEVVKYGLLGDRAFFDWCVTHGRDAITGDKKAQAYAIAYSCRAKARIVAEDEREAGKRALLNLGHTFGHALESATGFSEVLNHGEAVAIGIVMAFHLAARLGLCPQKDYEAVRAHLETVGLLVAPPPFAYDVDKLMGFMAADKKAEDGKITLILPHGIGKAEVHKNVSPEDIRTEWKFVLASRPSAVPAPTL